MRFFANSTINRIYLHSALQSFAENAGGLFLVTYLMKSGFGAPFALLTFSALVLCRLLFRQGLYPYARLVGLKAALITGNLLAACGYLLLTQVHGPGLALAAFLLVAALGEGFYWTSFHALSATLGDVEARGSQVSLVQLIYSLSAIAGPAVGGLLLSRYGGTAAFLLSASSQALATLPLLGIANPVLPDGEAHNAEANRFAWRIYFGDGLMAAGATYSWSLALFITLGESFEAYGFAQAAAALTGAVMALGVGRLFDLGHHKWSAGLALSVLAVAVLARALGYGTPATAFIGLGLGALAGPLYGSAFNARVYNLAKASGNPLLFHIQGEGGWDVGAALGCGLAALMQAQGAAFVWPVSLGLLGLGAVAATLHGSFQKAEPSLRV
ncbi:MAG: MFS transporter [Alphaproteobacteria bacterium]|nr:MFS transporter [Alphaproteobacteria bacterium]